MKKQKELIKVQYTPSTRLNFTRPDSKVTSGSHTRKYGELVFNPVVKTALDNVLIGTFWSHFRVQSQENNPIYTVLDDKIIRCIEDTMEKVHPDSFTNILRSILYDSLVFGFSVAEYVWDDETGRLVVLRTKAPYDFDFNINSYGDLDGLYHDRTGTKVEKQDIYRFMVSPYPYLLDSNWYGKSELQAIYHEVKLIEILEEAQVRGVKLISVKPILHFFKAGERSEVELQDVQNALYALDSGAIVSIPIESTENVQDVIQVLEDRASSTGIANIQDIINMCHKRIMRAIGVPDNLGFTDTNIGSLAKAREEMDMFTSRLIRNQEYIMSLVNRQIIPAMLRYTYPYLPSDYRLPKIVFETIEESYLEKITTYVTGLVSAGIVDPKEAWIRELLDLPAKEKTTRKRKWLSWL